MVRLSFLLSADTMPNDLFTSVLRTAESSDSIKSLHLLLNLLTIWYDWKGPHRCPKCVDTFLCSWFWEQTFLFSFLHILLRPRFVALAWPLFLEQLSRGPKPSPVVCNWVRLRRVKILNQKGHIRRRKYQGEKVIIKIPFFHKMICRSTPSTPNEWGTSPATSATSLTTCRSTRLMGGSCIFCKLWLETKYDIFCSTFLRNCFDNSRCFSSNFSCVSRSFLRLSCS